MYLHIWSVPKNKKVIPDYSQGEAQRVKMWYFTSNPAVTKQMQ